MAFERLRQAGGGLGNVARALSHRNYRVHISGNSIQLTGTWLQRVSCGWLAWTAGLGDGRPLAPAGLVDGFDPGRLDRRPFVVEPPLLASAPGG